MKAIKLFSILFVFALIFIGCKNPAGSDSVPNMSLSLSEAGENSVRLTLNGGNWQQSVDTNVFTGSRIRLILDWVYISGGIESLNQVDIAFTRESDTELLVEFYKRYYAGKGTVRIIDKFASTLYFLTDMDLSDIDNWTTHENDPVAIDLK